MTNPTNLTDEGLRREARKQTRWMLNPMEFKYGESPTPEADAYLQRADIMELAMFKTLQQVRDAAKKEERERCAKVAENATCFTDETSTVGEIIASAIRQMGGGK